MTPDATPGLPRRLAVLIGAGEAALLVFLLTQSGGGAGLLFVVFVGVTAAVGWLLSLRVPGNPIGWLLLVIAGLLLLGPPTQAWGEAVLDTRPSLAAWLLWYGGDRAEQWAWLPPIGLTFTQLLLLFPDGRLPSPRWRTFSRFTIGAVVLGTAVLAMFEVEVAPGLPSPTGLISPDSALTLPVTLLLLAAFAGSAASLVVRFRRADALQRAQIKWVALAGGVVVAIFTVDLTDFLIRHTEWGGFGTNLVLASFSLIPLSIGVAVLRYRLYEIDRIISRTVSYAIVTGVVLGAYAAVVTSVSRLAPGSNALAVAAATLVAAAVFRPVLRRIQDLVDGRFNRARFDGVHEVDAFAARLRDSVDADATAADLRATVERTLAPGSIGVWAAHPGGRP